MFRVHALRSIAILSLVLLLTACSKKEEIDRHDDIADQEGAASRISYESSSDSTIYIALAIDGCSCRQYESFILYWDSDVDSLINIGALVDVLTEGDTKGLLLCDCSHGEGEKLSGMIKSIEPLETRTGLLLTTKEKVWLLWDDVTPNLKALFQEHQATLFSGREFKIY